MTEDASAPKPASPETIAINHNAAAKFDFAETADFDRAKQGMISQIEPPVITGAAGNIVWDLSRFDFIVGDAPPSVHPSLWRQAQLNNVHGLFEVVPGIYQVRGYDISNISFIRSDSGWIVIDPLTVAETAKAARDLIDDEFGPLPIVAVIFTHSHGDHYGGIRGIVTDEELASEKVRIIAPEGFLEAAISENVTAGPAMNRRAMYMYGLLLPAGPHGHIDAGLGKTVPMGTRGLVAPTESITETGAELTIDGVVIEFQLTPGTEAPAEMNFYFPSYRAVCMAENCTATLHNVYTPRGAVIRDSLAWSKYIDDALDLFAHRSDVAFASHHWPRWGDADVTSFLSGQRDIYRYLHDETMRLANHGYTSLEIAEMVTLPAAIADEWFNRDYYGTVSHNVKAVYQRYLGWFDANPAHLHELPPVESSVRFVDYMGGADAVIERALVDFAAGEYRWVAQVMNHVVFADPTNVTARQLQADALEQLGYQAESGPWRAFYLTGAQELRNGTPHLPGIRGAVSLDVMAAMTPSMVLDNCAVKLNGPRAANRSLAFDLSFSDRGETYQVFVVSGTLRHRTATGQAPAADTSVSCTVQTFIALTSELMTVEDAVATQTLRVTGSAEPLKHFVSLLDQFDVFFPIIEP
ncbi:MAG: alkyl sulfatase dimerization domain-containing protein [Actinomycetes bacterium]